MSAAIVVEDREELAFLLCEAAEFEHAVMCTYLYALWSLKRGQAEGLSPQQAEAVETWRHSLRQIAREEMLHLCLVNNLLTALGSAPHLWKPEFPVRPGRFPAGLVMKLMPFSAAALDHFLYIERPEGVDLPDGKGFEHANYSRVTRAGLLSPAAQDYESQGHLYHGILHGLKHLSARYGEDRILVGHADAQVGAAEFGLPGLFKVTSLEAAHRAIEEIVTQGEGAPAHSETSHFARFARMREELAQLTAADPGFAPARPVAENPALAAEPDGEVRTRISDAAAGRVVDLGNALYALTMRTLAQVFSPAPLPEGLRRGLAVGSTELMYALQTVGEAATLLPSGTNGANAGLTFALPRSAGQLVQSCAGQILSERTRELAAAARALPGLAEVGVRLENLCARFDRLHEDYESRLALAVRETARVSPRTPPPADAPDDPNVARGKDVVIRFDAARCIHSRHCVLGAPSVFRAGMKGAWLNPQGAGVEEIVRVAHNCPSGAITYERLDGGPPERTPEVNLVRVRENGPYAVHAGIAMEGAHRTRATLCRCGRSKTKPYCDNSHIAAGFAATGEPPSLETDLLEFRGGELSVEPLPDGPLQLLGNVEIVSGTGRTLARAQNARLCRCGASASKPFCDGTHSRIGFKS